MYLNSQNFILKSYLYRKLSRKNLWGGGEGVGSPQDQEGLTLFQLGGCIPPPPGISLAMAININRSTPNFLPFKICYRGII